MITWSGDVNLERICEGLNKYISGYEMHDYYIYGLQQQDRPHIRVGPSCSPELIALFQKSGYKLEVTNSNSVYCRDCDDHHTSGSCHCDGEVVDCQYCNPDTVTIGIRRDVRRNAKMTRKLIKTIVFAMENKLIVENNAKIKLGRGVVKNPKVKKVTKQEKLEVAPNLEIDEGVTARDLQQLAEAAPPNLRTTLMQGLRNIVSDLTGQPQKENN